MSFNSKQTYTARKQHRCGETRTIINPGERYSVYSWLFSFSFLG